MFESPALVANRCSTKLYGYSGPFQRFVLTTHSNNFDDIFRAIVRIDHRSMTLEFEASKSHSNSSARKQNHKSIDLAESG